MDAEKRVLMTMIVMQQQHKNSKEGKDLFRKSIIRYQIYPAIYSQLDCFEAPKHGLRTPNEAFFHLNPELLGLGRQFGQINSGTVSPLSIRHLLRLFDCLARPNLSATLATDLK